MAALALWGAGDVVGSFGKTGELERRAVLLAALGH